MKNIKQIEPRTFKLQGNLRLKILVTYLFVRVLIDFIVSVEASTLLGEKDKRQAGRKGWCLP